MIDLSGVTQAGEPDLTSRPPLQPGEGESKRSEDGGEVMAGGQLRGSFSHLRWVKPC